MYFLLPTILYIILYIPYLYLIPANDGNLEYLFSYQWFQGKNIIHLISLHPPLKFILFSTFFTFFGTNSTGFVGLLLGIIGIIALYFIAKKLFDKKIAILSSLFLSLSGLYIAVALFSVRDFLMTVFILVAFAFYLNAHYTLYALFACIAVLAKETAVFFALGILLSDYFFRRKFSLATFMPIILLVLYLGFLHFSGTEIWNEWNFSSTADKGSIYTMIYNLISLQIFNKYAYENWLHLFIFNFNWVYWIFAIVSFFFIKGDQMKRQLLPIGLFFLFFLFTVLSFQTYTINRYTLPLIPFMYLFASYGVYKIKYKIVFIPLLILISFISLSRSVDPISNAIWPKRTILGENIYLKEQLDGADGITYNMQYLFIMKERTEMIKNHHCRIPMLITYDYRTLTLLHIHSCN